MISEGVVQAVKRHRVRSVLALVLAVGVTVTAVSYLRAITAPGTDGIGVRSVEWVRSHGGSGLVRRVESIWYSHHQPARGGVADTAVVRHTPTTFSPKYLLATVHLPAPRPLHPIITPALAGEGHWTPVGRLVGGLPAVYTTYLRPDPLHRGLVTGVAWIDSDLVRATLFSGFDVPGVTGFHDVAPTSGAENKTLVAEFNSGFRMQDAYGGYYSEGRLVYTMRPGAASLVIGADGRATVAQWGRDATMASKPASVRQNLDLIVDRGRPVPGVSSDTTHRWGATLGNNLFVWRSGLGVTPDGALVYAGGAGLSVFTLANVLAHAGAVRAMELDINTDWVDFFYFHPAPGQAAAPVNGTKLVSTMAESTRRYFEPSSRDFIALFANPRTIRH